jgi:hypothetical protein
VNGADVTGKNFTATPVGTPCYALALTTSSPAVSAACAPQRDLSNSPECPPNSYKQGTGVPLRASSTCTPPLARTRYFLSWKEGATVVSTSPSFTYATPNRPVTLVAVYSSGTQNLTAADAHRNDAGQYQIALSWQADAVPGTMVQIAYREPSAFAWEYTDWVTPAQDDLGQYALGFNPPSGCVSYILMVRMRDGLSGEISEWSSVIEANSTPTVPSAPTAGYSFCLPGASSGYLSWGIDPQEACSVTGFTVEQAMGLEWTPVYRVPATGAAWYAITNVTCSGILFRVKARIGEADGPYRYFTATPWPHPYIPPPKQTVSIQLVQPDIRIADLNSDVAYDAVLQNAYFKGSSNGLFTDASGSLQTTAGDGDRIRIGDMNGDGLLDRLVAHQKSLWIEYANSGGNFTQGPSAALDETIADFVGGYAPMNVNGTPQVMVGSKTKITFLSLSGDAWAVVSTLPTSLDIKALALGDLNNDGLTDILAGGKNGAAIFYQTVDALGQWQQETVLPGVDVPSVDIADVTGDGFLDIALARQGASSPLVYVFARTPGSDPEARPAPHTWTPGALPSDFTLPNVRQVVFGDLAGTGLPGLFCVTEEAQKSAYFQSDRAGGLLPADLVLPGKVTAVAEGDFDGNGALDFAAAGTHTLDVYEGLYETPAESTEANQLPSAPVSYSAELLNERLTLSWTPGSDDKTPRASLTYEFVAGTSPGATDLFRGEAGQQGTSARPGNLRTTTQAVIPFPAGIDNVYWAIRSVDSSLLRGPWLKAVTHSDGTSEVISGSQKP